MNESQLVSQIKNLLKSRGAYCEKIFGGGFQASGIPDIIACYKGLFIGIEAKSPTGKGRASDIQKIKIRTIRDSGGIALVVDNTEEVKKLLDFIDDWEYELLGQSHFNSTYKYDDKYLKQ